MSSPRFSRLYARSVFYPTLAWNYMLARVFNARRWWDRIDPHVIVGAYPFRRDVEGLYNEGVRAVVNTCEEYAGPIVQYERHGIEQLRIPTTDFTHPRLKDIEQAVDFIQKHVDRGDTVYIHCKAGRARSATVAICWLMKYRGLSIDDAQARLLETRPHIHPQLTGRPVVREFAESILHRPAESTVAVPENATSENATPENATPDNATSENATPENATPESFTAASENLASENRGPEPEAGGSIRES